MALGRGDWVVFGSGSVCQLATATFPFCKWARWREGEGELWARESGKWAE